MADERDRSIDFWAATKSAVEITAGELDIEEVKANIKALVDFKAELVPAQTPAKKGSGSSQKRSGGQQSSSGGVQKGFEPTDDPCPQCQEDGRDGLIAENTTGSGPARQCTLRERRKIGSAWKEVGDCDWVDWGN